MRGFLSTGTQISNQKLKEEQNRFVSRLAFAAKSFICNQKAVNDFPLLKIQLLAIEKRESEGAVVNLPEHPLWNGVVDFLKL